MRAWALPRSGLSSLQLSRPGSPRQRQSTVRLLHTGPTLCLLMKSASSTCKTCVSSYLFNSNFVSAHLQMAQLAQNSNVISACQSGQTTRDRHNAPGRPLPSPPKAGSMVICASKAALNSAYSSRVGLWKTLSSVGGRADDGRASAGSAAPDAIAPKPGVSADAVERLIK